MTYPLVHIPRWKNPVIDLPARTRKALFFALWPQEPKTAICPDCGASEGKDLNTYCARTRGTNMLHLYRWSDRS